MVFCCIAIVGVAIIYFIGLWIRQIFSAPRPDPDHPSLLKAPPRALSGNGSLPVYGHTRLFRRWAGDVALHFPPDWVELSYLPDAWTRQLGDCFAIFIWGQWRIVIKGHENSKLLLQGQELREDWPWTPPYTLLGKSCLAFLQHEEPEQAEELRRVLESPLSHSVVMQFAPQFAVAAERCLESIRQKSLPTGNGLLHWNRPSARQTEEGLPSPASTANGDNCATDQCTVKWEDLRSYTLDLIDGPLLDMNLWDTWNSSDIPHSKQTRGQSTKEEDKDDTAEVFVEEIEETNQHETKRRRKDRIPSRERMLLWMERLKVGVDVIKLTFGPEWMYIWLLNEYGRALNARMYLDKILSKHVEKMSALVPQISHRRGHAFYDVTTQPIPLLALHRNHMRNNEGIFGEVVRRQSVPGGKVRQRSKSVPKGRRNMFDENYFDQYRPCDNICVRASDYVTPFETEQDLARPKYERSPTQGVTNKLTVSTGCRIHPPLLSPLVESALSPSRRKSMKELAPERKTVLCTGSMPQFSLNAIMTPTLNCNAVAFTHLQSEPFSVQSFEDKIELAAPSADFSEHIPMEFFDIEHTYSQFVAKLPDKDDSPSQQYLGNTTPLTEDETATTDQSDNHKKSLSELLPPPPPPPLDGDMSLSSPSSGPEKTLNSIGSKTKMKLEPSTPGSVTKRKKRLPSPPNSPSRYSPTSGHVRTVCMESGILHTKTETRQHPLENFSSHQRKTLQESQHNSPAIMAEQAPRTEIPQSLYVRHVGFDIHGDTSSPSCSPKTRRKTTRMDLGASSPSGRRKSMPLESSNQKRPSSHISGAFVSPRCDNKFPESIEIHCNAHTARTEVPPKHIVARKGSPSRSPSPKNRKQHLSASSKSKATVYRELIGVPMLPALDAPAESSPTITTEDTTPIASSSSDVTETAVFHGNMGRKVHSANSSARLTSRNLGSPPSPRTKKEMRKFSSKKKIAHPKSSGVSGSSHKVPRPSQITVPSKQKENGMSLLEMLLRQQGPEERGITRTIIMELCMNLWMFLDVGNAWTAMALQLLAMDRSALKVVVEEIDKLDSEYGEDLFSPGALERMKYLDALLYESIRLLPPFLGGLKTTTETVELENAGVQVPKGSHVFFCRASDKKFDIHEAVGQRPELLGDRYPCVELFGFLPLQGMEVPLMVLQSKVFLIVTLKKYCPTVSKRNTFIRLVKQAVSSAKKVRAKKDRSDETDAHESSLAECSDWVEGDHVKASQAPAVFQTPPPKDACDVEMGSLLTHDLTPSETMKWFTKIPFPEPKRVIRLQPRTQSSSVFV